MKNSIIVLFAFVASLSIISCDKGDVFTGSPNDSGIAKVELQGTISTTETEVVAGQPFPLTVTIPQAFDVNVSVEATSFSLNTNKRYRGTVIIPAGQTSITFQMKAPGSDTADMPFKSPIEVYLSAITTDPIDEKIGFDGVQYSLTSNKLSLDYGDSLLSVPNASVLSVRIDSEGPHYVPTVGALFNGLNYRVIKNGVFQASIPGKATTGPPNNPVYNSFYGKSNFADKVELNILGVAENNSSTDGEYIIKIYASKLVSSPLDLNSRFTFRFPDETAKTISVLLPNLVALPSATINASTPGVEVIKIIKSTDTVTGKPVFQITTLL